MKHVLKKYAHRIVAFSLFAAVLGCAWDIWWHVAMGRDSNWEPPHLFVYACIALAIGTTFQEWHETRSRMWRRLLVTLAAVPFAAAFDQVWHDVFGSEDITHPLIVLSPPHIVLVSFLIASALLTLPLLHHDRDARAQEFFGALLFGTVFTLAMFFTVPFHPTSYGFAVLGFAGAGVVAYAFVLALLGAADWRQTFAGATLATIVFLLFYNISFGRSDIGEMIEVNPHNLPPIWLHAFACLAAAGWTDISRAVPLWLRGGVAGLLFGFIHFVFLSAFSPPEFRYGMDAAGVAVASCACGGALAGAVMGRLRGHVHHLARH